VFSEEVKEKKEREHKWKIKHYTQISLAAVGGGALLGMLC